MSLKLIAMEVVEEYEDQEEKWRGDKCRGVAKF